MIIADSRKMAEIDGLYDCNTLIERAGKALALSVLDSGKSSCLAVCGGGKNGSDGYSAALHLFSSGFEADCLSLTGADGDRQGFRNLFEKAGGRVFETFDPDLFAKYGVIIDACFGTGLNRAPSGAYEEAISGINASGSYIISADIPSGLEADSGRVFGACIKANETVTFTLPKTAHFLRDDLCGRLTIRDIGISAEIIGRYSPYPKSFGLAEARALLPKREAVSHKGNYGRALLYIGSTKYPGAAIMATRAALRGGCGLVYAACPAPVAPTLAGVCPEAIMLPLECNADGSFTYSSLADPNFTATLNSSDAILAGSGVLPAPAAKDALASFVKSGKPLVIDAGMLNFLSRSGISDGKARICLKGSELPLHKNVVITPHAGELARICGGDYLLPGENPIECALRLSKEAGAVLVMKGHRTITASPDGRCYVNTSGNAGMAKGGSGDVLAGLVTSLAARRRESFFSAALAVFIHSLSGDICAEALGTEGMTPLDIAERLPHAFSKAMKE